MPYVQRDHKGNIVGLYAGPQEPIDGIPRHDPEPLPDDHPDVVAFLQKIGPAPWEGRSPRSPEEMLADIRRAQAETARIGREHEAIKTAAERFTGAFATLETALSALLYALLNLRASQVAYAIYYSPNSFDARVEIVENALIQVVSENPEITCLTDQWKTVRARLDKTRNLRNALAHGIQQTLSIRGKAHARFSPLPFDVIRLGRPIAQRQIPGLGSHDILQGVQNAIWARESIDILNRIMHDFFDGAPTWKQRFHALEKHLKKPRNP